MHSVLMLTLPRPLAESGFPDGIQTLLGKELPQVDLLDSISKVPLIFLDLEPTLK